jgi:enoyl-CoA hydratase
MGELLSGYERLVFDRQGYVLQVTMNRPDRLNAVDSQMHHELERFFTQVDEDPESRAVLLTGAGRARVAT